MKRILLVHDRQDNPLERKLFLESSGYSVELLTSGESCLESAKENRPNLVVMDILLEGPNGFEACRQLREHFSTTELPVILCSEVYRTRRYRDEAAAAGAQAYVLKPVHLRDLVGKIATILSQDAVV